MGKKSTWLSAVKRVFTSNSKNSPLNQEADKTSWKKKKGVQGGRLKHGTFIPHFREPSSIEKILGEVDQQRLFIEHPQPQQQEQQPQQQEQQPQQQQQHHQQKEQQPSSSYGRPVSPISRPRIDSPPPRPALTYRPTEISQKPQPTLKQQHISATSIQAAYRGHMARRKRNVRGLTGNVRLQGIISSQNVKQQTANAMKQMQLLVRVQTQIQSRRIEKLENQALKRQANNNDKQVESSLGNNTSEMGDEYWDDSVITKEEKEATLQKKVEAIIKRERAMAYAYSHKLGKTTPTSAAQTCLMDLRTGGYPWWWNWLDRQLPSQSRPQPPKNHPLTTSSFRPTPDHKLSQKEVDISTTPLSSRSMAPSRTRNRTHPNRMMKYSNAGGGGSPYSMKDDDDSMMSCPAFSVPNYMSPTVSAKAKSRPTSNPKDRVSPSTPGSETSKRRFSFPITPDSKRGNRSPRSVGDMSVNSAVSVPASLGRKPFNRFV
ncbi:protein IQ-DOMAIN 13-like [Rutidosis leptorrhynchoides]|uniref:protein IQ-DOMAIN 13-like n=1 Tax=Rutidosis leptorrhynchoides TaxID=125765 RepID=UPI003A9934C5